MTSGCRVMGVSPAKLSSHVILAAICFYLHHILHMQWTAKRVSRPVEILRLA